MAGKIKSEHNREAFRLAEWMHYKLQEKRRNPQPLTPEEELAKREWLRDRTPKTKCMHLKGGQMTRWGWDKYGGGTCTRDYNLACFTFVNFRSRIWCLNGCGFVSNSGDPNWAEALAMFKQSTNTRASSEEAPTKRQHWSEVK